MPAFRCCPTRGSAEPKNGALLRGVPKPLTTRWLPAGDSSPAALPRAGRHRFCAGSLVLVEDDCTDRSPSPGGLAPCSCRPAKDSAAMACGHHRPGLYPADDIAGHFRHGLARFDAACAHLLLCCLAGRAADLAELRPHDPPLPLLGLGLYLCAKGHSPQCGLHGGLVLVAGLSALAHGQYPAGQDLSDIHVPRGQPLGLDRRPDRADGLREPARHPLRRPFQWLDRLLPVARHRRLHLHGLARSACGPQCPGCDCRARWSGPVDTVALLERPGRDRCVDYGSHHSLFFVHRL